MSKVTYLLGAGSSYGSRGVLPHFPFMSSDNQELPKGILRGLPILSEFPKAVTQMQREINFGNIEEGKKLQIREILINISNISKEYPTIDTYSKMLYTTKQFEEYEKFKEQIALFFLIWQRSHKHDIRYDSFIASLIDADTGKFPPMTILTWNYDMQFEMSYSKYITEGQALWKIWDRLNVCCKSNGSLPKYNVNNPFAYIKLNGSAIFHASERDKASLRCTLQDILWTPITKEQFWDEVCTIYENSQHKNILAVPKYINELSYAWDAFGKEYIKQNISQRGEDCEVLVIIGYSFPYVNREIDRHIFMNMPNLQTIYVQDIDATNITERVKAIYEYLKKDAPRIIPKTDVGQFFIPNELG